MGEARALQRLALAVVFTPACYGVIYLLFYYGGRYVPEAGEFLEGLKPYGWVGAALLSLLLATLVY